MTVYIIVLHYKNIPDTTLCLESIKKLKKNKLKIKIILVNNNPNHNFHLLNLSTKFKNLRVITNVKNLGFAAGVNIGIKEALHEQNAKYILILNNDTILPSKLLTELLKTPADITAPIIKFKWNNTWKYDFGGKVNWWTGRTTHMEVSHRKMKPLYPETVDYVSGCCMLIKRNVFKKIGLFDEKYFFYFEDVDFCIRAKKENLSIKVNPKTYVYHKLGGSIGRWSNKAIFYNLWSNFLFITKHLGWKRFIGYFYLLLLTAKIIFDKLMQPLRKMIILSLSCFIKKL